MPGFCIVLALILLLALLVSPWLFLGLLVLAFLLFFLTAYVIRWYEEARRASDERGLWDFSLKDALPLLAEAATQLALIALTLADLLLSIRHWSLRRQIPATLESAAPETPPLPAGGRPIICIHGLGMRGLSMYPLARKLKKAGYRPHYFTYTPPGLALEAYARQLRDFIEKLCLEKGYTDFDTVCHSAGGLICRKYLALWGAEKRIRRLITIGTPHGGSELWRFAPLPAGLQIKPGGAFLQGLDAAPLPAGVAATAISGDFDQLVIPNANARWEAPGVKNHTISGSGHTRLLFHPKTFRIVKEALG
ncbi:MAG: hypothetical protein O2807_13660 [bacterium]|nr:hypothetical protein [bacterium]